MQATLAVTPGATLNVTVGAQGTTQLGYAGAGGTGGGLVAVTTSGGSPLLTAGSGGGAGGPGIAVTPFPGIPGGNSATPGSAGGGSSVAAGGDGAGVFTFPNPKADISVDVTAQPHVGILVPYLTYTLTAHNAGPDAVTSATLTASLPTGASATDLSAGCTAGIGTVTCVYGAIPNGTSVAKSFRVPLSLLSLGHVSVTGTRTTSAPNDPNAANDSDTATCTVVSIVLATCP